jgi:hypothetical protein
VLRVYVAGESIEQRNHYVAAPFLPGGVLNDRGGGALRNDTDEYGWMVPLADRLALRDATLSVQWVGSGVWTDADDNPYSGTHPSAVASPTSAMAGTSIQSWMDARSQELQQRALCYDVAFASRGGNDFGLDDAQVMADLKALLVLLDAGSSCQAHPLICVTGHMPDDQRGGGPPDNATYVGEQVHRFVERIHTAMMEAQVEHPQMRLRFVDQYTPFTLNTPTTAFPQETWSVGGVPDDAKITREGDPMHPRRLASIYVGELTANALDLTELHGL